jgi:hypothetical protein
MPQCTPHHTAFTRDQEQQLREAVQAACTNPAIRAALNHMILLEAEDWGIPVEIPDGDEYRGDWSCCNRPSVRSPTTI